jgi:hypothetical protein
MSAPLHDEIRTNPPTGADKSNRPAEGRPDYAAWQSISEVNPSWAAAIFAFLVRLKTHRLIAVTALTGIIITNVELARAGSGLTAFGLIGAGTGELMLAAIALVALAWERKREHGQDR